MNHPELSQASTEGIEAEALYQLESAVPELVSDLLGISTTRFAGGVVLSMRDDASGGWSWAVGLGATEPVTFDLVADVIDIWEANRSPSGVLALAPSVLPDDWPSIASAHDLSLRGHLVRHIGRVGELDLGPAARAARMIRPEEVSDWARIMAGGQPTPVEDLFAASVFHEAFRSFAIWEGGRMVAAASLVIKDGQGLLHRCATLPGYEGGTARQVLVQARVQAAAGAGCEWVSAGTAESGPAFHAMRRTGMSIAYRRPNWAWPG